MLIKTNSREDITRRQKAIINEIARHENKDCDHECFKQPMQDLKQLSDRVKAGRG